MVCRVCFGVGVAGREAMVAGRGRISIGGAGGLYLRRGVCSSRVIQWRVKRMPPTDAVRCSAREEASGSQAGSRKSVVVRRECVLCAGSLDAGNGVATRSHLRLVVISCGARGQTDSRGDLRIDLRVLLLFAMVKCSVGEGEGER